MLAHAGQLESRQGQGTYVISRADPAAVLLGMRRAGIRDVLELRIAMEAEGARLAAVRRTPEDLERMRSALGSVHDHGAELTGGAQADDDVRFHQYVVEAAHNAALTEVYRYFSSSVRETLLAAVGDSDMPPIDLAAHTALVDAIEAGDPQAADGAARALLREPLRAVEALLAAAPDHPTS